MAKRKAKAEETESQPNMKGRPMSSEPIESIIEYQSDLADAEAPEALPAGQYPCQVVGATNGVSQSSGKDRVEVELLIDPADFPPDYADADEYAEGKVVKMYVSSSDEKSARFRMRKFCEALQVPLGRNIDLNDWVSRKCIVTVEEDSFEDVPMNRARRIEAI